jgi:hypothetical protein
MLKKNIKKLLSVLQLKKKKNNLRKNQKERLKKLFMKMKMKMKMKIKNFHIQILLKNQQWNK